MSQHLDMVDVGIEFMVGAFVTGADVVVGQSAGIVQCTVAGVAALVKSYFPKLTGSQIRDILLKSVTSRKGVEVEKGIRVNDSPSQDLFLFDDLCISGGIVNAYQAILEAEKVSK